MLRKYSALFESTRNLVQLGLLIIETTKLFRRRITVTSHTEKTEEHEEGDKKSRFKDRLKDIKEKVHFEVGEKAKSTWIKALYMVFFIIASWLAIFVSLFVIVFQFIGELIFKKPNEHLQNFGETLGLYFCAVMRFMTSSSDEMPFPFKPWPKSGSCTEKHKH